MVETETNMQVNIEEMTGEFSLSWLPIFNPNEYRVFEEEIKKTVSPEMSTSEKVNQVVVTALKIEFGDAVLAEQTMITTITDAILSDQEQIKSVESVVSKLLAPETKKRKKPIN